MSKWIFLPILVTGCLSQNLFATGLIVSLSSEINYSDANEVQDTAKVRGILLNSTGSPIPSATVSLFSQNGSLLTTTSTDTSGVYQFNNIAEQNMYLTYRHINF